MFLQIIAEDDWLNRVRWQTSGPSVQVSEEDQAWCDTLELVQDHVDSLLPFRRSSHITIYRNRHPWKLGEEIEAGNVIVVKPMESGGLFPGGFVGWHSPPGPLIWTTIAEAQFGLGQLAGALQQRQIHITRNGRNVDGNPQTGGDTFRCWVQVRIMRQCHANVWEICWRREENTKFKC
jgi:hypothetical protein